MVIGRVGGFRGRAGEMTIRVASGVAGRWTGLRHVGLCVESDGGDETRFEVEAARAYGERLVLKLRGVDDANAAQGLKGRWVAVSADELPSLPEGEHFTSGLVGRRVEDAVAGRLGEVADVVATGGADLLVVRTPAGDELLIPFARAIATRVTADCIHVALPDGLLDLNRAEGPAQ